MLELMAKYKTFKTSSNAQSKWEEEKRQPRAEHQQLNKIGRHF